MRDELRRQRNENKFGAWEELPGGGRRYFYEIQGRYGWLARYVKEVDASGSTVRFYQKIYDETGCLIEVHEKYPVDGGHKKVEGGGR